MNNNPHEYPDPMTISNVASQPYFNNMPTAAQNNPQHQAQATGGSNPPALPSSKIPAAPTASAPPPAVQQGRPTVVQHHHPPPSGPTASAASAPVHQQQQLAVDPQLEDAKGADGRAVKTTKTDEVGGLYDHMYGTGESEFGYWHAEYCISHNIPLNQTESSKK